MGDFGIYYEMSKLERNGIYINNIRMSMMQLINWEEWKHFLEKIGEHSNLRSLEALINANNRKKEHTFGQLTRDF